MVVKIIWALVCLNSLALLVFIGAYFVMNEGRHPDYQEKGWTMILAGLGLLVILFSAIPLYYSQSTGSVIIAGFFAALPLAIFISKKLPSFKKEKTSAETFYADKIQRAIATAIEKNDTVLVKELIKGQDLSVQGIKVWDRDGLNYLQFAIHLRSNLANFPLNEVANTAAIHLLIANGSPVTPALPAATKYLPFDMIVLLLDAGANPNCRDDEKPNPLLFYTMGQDEKKNNIAILLLQRGADKNAISDEKLTPVMQAAFRAGVTQSWVDAWRVVRYLLEQAHADYRYTNKNGVNLAAIIRNIRTEAGAGQINMCPDFDAVVEWLAQQGVDTAPAK